MKDEYIIINRTALEKINNELKFQREREPDNHTQSYLDGKIKQINETLSQSVPLIPIIEEAFDEGSYYGKDFFNDKILEEDKQYYILNFKLHI